MPAVNLKEWADFAGVPLFDLGHVMGAAWANAEELDGQTRRQEERLRFCPDVDVLLGIQHAAAGQRIVLSRLEEIRRILRQEVG